MRLTDRGRQSFKLAIATLCHYTGMVELYRRQTMKNRAVILLYHRIMSDEESLIDYSPNGMAVSIQNFDKQMRYLSRHYKVLPLTELIDRVKSGKNLTGYYCSITFDDGWRDNFTNAFPILRKYNLPATIFLTTNFVNNEKWFWEERVKYLLTHLYCAAQNVENTAGSIELVEPILGKYQISELLTLNPDNLRAYLTTIVKKLRTESSAKQQQFCHDLELITRHSDFSEPRRFLNWDEIREMLQTNIEFGAHSKSHINFDLCDNDQAKTEIEQSKHIVEQQIKQSVSIFAYPYGKNNDNVTSMVKNAGFKYAFTTIPGFVSHNTDNLRVPRIDIHNDQSPTRAFFACRISKFLNIY